MEYKTCKYLVPIELPQEQEWMLEAAQKMVAERMKDWCATQDEITLLVLCGYPPAMTERVLRSTPMNAKTFISVFGPPWKYEE